MRADASEYDLVSPGSLDAVLALLAQAPGEWTPIAGGTELMVQFGAGRLRARKLVDIFGLPELTTIGVAGDVVRIGAGVTYTAIRSHAELCATLPLLARAASWTGSIANQNRGTLGGNLVNGSPAADSPPALLAYEASVELISARGARTIPYADFHTGYKTTVLAPDELVLSVIIPSPSAGLRQYLRKVGPRNAMAISKVALAAVATLDGGTIRKPRIGEKKAATTLYLASSESEQAAAQDTLTPVAEALLLGNHAYEEKFGFRYIVFASGRTAPELLAVLEARLANARAEELQEAARQQQRITNLRLRKWLT